LASLTKIDQVTPNLNFTVGTGGGGSTVNAFIRGVGETDFIVTTDPAVGLYLDGVYMARAFGANMELKDIERIEVLRGPQGSLFGKNSIGGAINVVTRKPGDETEAELSLGIGSENLRTLSLYGQTALSDSLSASLSLMHRKADGWQARPDRDAGDEDVTTVRTILAWDVSDNFESRLSVDWSDRDQTGYPNVMLSFQNGTTFGDLWNMLNPANPCCTPNADIDVSNAAGPLPNDKVEAWGVNWTNTWQLGDLQLKSITAYREMEALFGRDGDNSANAYTGDIHDQDHEQFSQEFQLSSDGEKLQWVLGAYFFEEESIDDTDLIIIEGLGVSVNFHNVADTTSYALFAHANYSLTEKLDLYGGIRYTREEKDFSQRIRNLDFGFPHAFPIPGMPVASCDFDVAAAFFDCSQDWSNTSPKLGLAYHMNDDVMLYTHISRGFRSGGYNGRAFGSAADLQEYEPETLTSYEAGIKAELLDNSLRLNAALFYNDYEDIQVLITRAGSVAVENASAATIMGGELELTWAATEAWQLQAGVGFINDDSDGWVDVTGDYTDTELKHTPDWTVNISSDYRVALGEMGLHLRVDAKYRSDYYIDDVNTELLHPGAHTLINAGLILRAGDERWDVALQGFNMTDKRVLNAGFDGSGFFGFVEGSYNRPRHYSLTATLRF
jgi:iron complex outermembrane receptor protein